MSGHTPGPWVWTEPQKILNAAHGRVIDHAPCEGMWFAAYDAKTDEANARLIAAAPELLEALCWVRDGETLKRENNEPGLSDELLTAIDSAIAKATGVQP